SLSAKDEGSGTVTGSGQISLYRNGPSNLKVNLTRFRLLDNDTIEATASGETTVVRGADGKARIAGTLTIDRAEINAATKLKPSVVSLEVIEINRPVALAEQLPPRKAGAALAALDITLRAPRRVFVKGRGINAEMSMNAHVGGSTSSPQLSGTARVVRGSYDFAGKRFEFEERGRVTLANRASDIALDLQASLQEPTVTAQILIRGSAARPEITLTSTPALPQDEILSQVLFGTSASQLSGAQAAQIASTLTALATGGGFDVLGSLRQFAQLDRLSFGTDTAGATTVAGGRYISDDVYLEIVGGGVRGPQVRVDWRVKRNLSILSELASRGDAKVSVRWRKELRARGGGRGVRSGEPAPER
ncbi:MAG: translocation/assembly module TamB domain-containing protein, partial [Caulobacteraceae bacterium]